MNQNNTTLCTRCRQALNVPGVLLSDEHTGRICLKCAVDLEDPRAMARAIRQLTVELAKLHNELVMLQLEKDLNP